MKVALLAVFACVGLCVSAHAEDKFVPNNCGGYVRNSNDTVRLYASGVLYSRNGNCWANEGNRGAASFERAKAVVTAPAPSQPAPNSYYSANSRQNTYSTVNSGRDSYSTTQSGGNTYSTVKGPGNAYSTYRNYGSTNISIEGPGPATVRFKDGSVVKR